MATYGATQIYTPVPKPKQIIHYDGPGCLWVEEDKRHPILQVERF